MNWNFTHPTQICCCPSPRITPFDCGTYEPISALQFSVVSRAIVTKSSVPISTWKVDGLSRVEWIIHWNCGVSTRMQLKRLSATLILLLRAKVPGHSPQFKRIFPIFRRVTYIATMSTVSAGWAILSYQRYSKNPNQYLNNGIESIDFDSRAKTPLFAGGLDVSEMWEFEWSTIMLSRFFIDSNIENAISGSCASHWIRGTKWVDPLFLLIAYQFIIQLFLGNGVRKSSGQNLCLGSRYRRSNVVASFGANSSEMRDCHPSNRVESKWKRTSVRLRWRNCLALGSGLLIFFLNILNEESGYCWSTSRRARKYIKFQLYSAVDLNKFNVATLQAEVLFLSARPLGSIWRGCSYVPVKIAEFINL